MKRLLVCVSFVLLLLAGAQSQNTPPSPQTMDNNQNAPDIKMQPNGPGSPAADNQQSAQPHTEMNKQANEAAVADSVLDPGPLPNRKLTLIGGVAKKVDPVRNRVLIQPFGGGKEVSVLFDERSQIFRDGRASTVLGIHRGDRVYADTMALGSNVFARTLRVETTSGPAEAHGQVLEFDPARHMVRMRDSLTSQLVTFSVSGKTSIHQKEEPGMIADLIPGTLLNVVFAPGRKGGMAQDINILAVPGHTYVFTGRITNMNLSRGLLAIDNESDGKNYEIRFDPATVADRGHLLIGADIATNAKFDGKGYTANSISIVQPVPTTAER